MAGNPPARPIRLPPLDLATQDLPRTRQIARAWLRVHPRKPNVSDLEVCSFPATLPHVNNHTDPVFIKEDPWRIFRIMAEFVDSFEVMSQVVPAAPICGSARRPPNDRHYTPPWSLAHAPSKPD